VMKDEWITPEELGSYEIHGLGGSDMSPAMELLAGDPLVRTVLVITDGEIMYPVQLQPYEVVWAVVGNHHFVPAYGQVVPIPYESDDNLW